MAEPNPGAGDPRTEVKLAEHMVRTIDGTPLSVKAVKGSEHSVGTPGRPAAPVYETFSLRVVGENLGKAKLFAAMTPDATDPSVFRMVSKADSQSLPSARAKLSADLALRKVKIGRGGPNIISGPTKEQYDRVAQDHPGDIIVTLVTPDELTRMAMTQEQQTDLARRTQEWHKQAELARTGVVTKDNLSEAERKEVVDLSMQVGAMRKKQAARSGQPVSSDLPLQPAAPSRSELIKMYNDRAPGSYLPQVFDVSELPVTESIRVNMQWKQPQ